MNDLTRERPCQRGINKDRSGLFKNGCAFRGCMSKSTETSGQRRRQLSKHSRLTDSSQPAVWSMAPRSSISWRQ